MMTNESAREIGRRIAEARRALGLTHEELARRVGVNWRTVQRWQKGDNLPPVHRLLAVAETLGIPTHELVRQDENVAVHLARGLAATGATVAEMAEELARIDERLRAVERRLAGDA